MTKLMDHAFLLAFLFIFLWQQDGYALPVVLILSALAFIGVQTWISSPKMNFILNVALILSSFFYWPFFLLCPFAFYELSRNSDKCYYLAALPVEIYVQYDNGSFTSTNLSINTLLCILAAFLAYKTVRQNQLETEVRKIRDEATEINLKLAAQNKAIMKKQDYEIHLATLSERNRIAREIHDNVGHMLSRTILQIGALLVVYKDNPVCQQLESIHGTLDQAMTSIRESVHDLHDDSIDLKMSLKECARDIEAKFKVTIDYDISSDMPREVKYCIISIVKEALSNAVKHSNGNMIHIIVREHPGFYQLSVTDNGTSTTTHSLDMDQLMNQSGIGIRNIKDRVDALQGTLRIHNKTGFQIFVSIPRKGGAK